MVSTWWSLGYTSTQHSAERMPRARVGWWLWKLSDSVTGRCEPPSGVSLLTDSTQGRGFTQDRHIQSILCTTRLGRTVRNPLCCALAPSRGSLCRRCHILTDYPVSRVVIWTVASTRVMARANAASPSSATAVASQGPATVLLMKNGSVISENLPLPLSHGLLATPAPHIRPHGQSPISATRVQWPPQRLVYTLTFYQRRE